MSQAFDNDERIWVGDLDGYINIDAINRENEQEASLLKLETELDELGEIPLLSGKHISAHLLNDRGISPDEWRWTVHEVEHALGNGKDWKDIEALFVKDLISLGKRYAVARYAQRENIPYSSAVTAIYPYGFIALLNQFLDSQKLSGNIAYRRSLQESLLLTSKNKGMTAYHRAGAVRLALYRIAQEIHGSEGHLNIEKTMMRNILSLARLRYSVSEIEIRSVREIRELYQLYEQARIMTKNETIPLITGRYIRNWQLRSLHPLLHLYPYSLRNAINRAVAHTASPSRAVAVNELALARCGILLMRKTAKSKAKSQ